MSKSIDRLKFSELFWVWNNIFMKFVLVKLLPWLVFVFEHFNKKLNSQNHFDRPSAKVYPREISQKAYSRKFVLAKLLKTGICQSLSSRNLQISGMVWFGKVNPRKCLSALKYLILSFQTAWSRIFVGFLWWWWWWWWWWWTVFVVGRRTLSFSFSRDHCQTFSLSQISDSLQAGFKSAQNLS